MGSQSWTSTTLTLEDRLWSGKWTDCRRCRLDRLLLMHDITEEQIRNRIDAIINEMSKISFDLFPILKSGLEETTNWATLFSAKFENGRSIRWDVSHKFISVFRIASFSINSSIWRLSMSQASKLRWLAKIISFIFYKNSEWSISMIESVVKNRPSRYRLWC